MIPLLLAVIRSILLASTLLRKSRYSEFTVLLVVGGGEYFNFISIFNQVGASVFAVHDLDTKLRADGGVNGMWTVNKNIRAAADAAEVGRYGCPLSRL